MTLCVQPFSTYYFLVRKFFPNISPSVPTSVAFFFQILGKTRMGEFPLYLDIMSLHCRDTIEHIFRIYLFFSRGVAPNTPSQLHDFAFHSSERKSIMTRIHHL